MKISLSWLQQYLKVDLSTDELSELLTDIGLEVEGIHKYETISNVQEEQQHGNVDFSSIF